MTKYTIDLPTTDDDEDDDESVAEHIGRKFDVAYNTE